jgi:hypothetical protein
MILSGGFQSIRFPKLSPLYLGYLDCAGLGLLDGSLHDIGLHEVVIVVLASLNVLS